MALENINLGAAEKAELKDKLDVWRVQERKKIEEELTEKYEQMEAELKEQSESLVDEIKDNMKKVYAKRFAKALKEMYEEIKAEVVMEAMNTPEKKALDEIKASIYPFINESTARRYKDEFAKIVQMYEGNLEELELMKGAKKKAQLMGTLTPDVSKVVDQLLGEGTEEEIVGKFAAIKEALKTDAPAAPAAPVAPVYEANDDLDEEIIAESSVEEEPAAPAAPAAPLTEDKDNEFQSFLDDQLRLAGLTK